MIIKATTSSINLSIKPVSGSVQIGSPTTQNSNQIVFTASKTASLPVAMEQRISNLESNAVDEAWLQTNFGAADFDFEQQIETHLTF